MTLCFSKQALLSGGGPGRVGGLVRWRCEAGQETNRATLASVKCRGDKLAHPPFGNTVVDAQAYPPYENNLERLRV